MDRGSWVRGSQVSRGSHPRSSNEIQEGRVPSGGGEAYMRTRASIGEATRVILVCLGLAVLTAGAARAAGPVVGWGVGAPPPLSSASAIARGESHGCAIEVGTGAVICWHRNSEGQASPPVSVDGTAGTATAIAAGTTHSCAIQAGTGAVVCWGSPAVSVSPPTSVDGTAGSASAIAAGGRFNSAIRAGSGAVVGWGVNDAGQPTPPPSVDGTDGTATAIAASGGHGCAIQAGSGAVVCWGRNDFGQAAPPPSVGGTTGTATAIA